MTRFLRPSLLFEPRASARMHGARPPLRETAKAVAGAMLRVSAILLASTLFVAHAGAVELQPDQLYEGGTELTASDVGITTSVPTGWKAVLPSGGEALLMQHAASGATIIVVSEETTEAQALADMGQTVDLGEGVRLEPTSSPSREGGVVAGRYRVLGTPEPGEAAIYTRVGPSGIGIAFFAIDASGQSVARDAARSLAGAVRFSKPRPPAPPRSEAAPGGEGNAAWQDYMRGRYIARFYSGSGYHEKTEIWLCSDGSFRRAGDAGGYGGGASGAWAGSGGGTWSATGTQPGAGELRLQFQDGVSSYALSLQGGKLYLDGTQWLRGENEYCR